MNSNELANLTESVLRQYTPVIASNEELERVIKLCREGILGPGKEQYERDGKQKFEDMPLIDLLGYIEEEARDLINYGVMMLWRLDQVNSALATALRHQMIQTLQSRGSIAPIASSDLPESTAASLASALYSTSPSTSLKVESPPEPKP